jgi:flagellar protein FliS
MSLYSKSSFHSGYDAYKVNEISTMSQGKLILMLYEGAIRFINIAIENNTPRKFESVHKNLMKAQEIINELMLSLNIEEGGDVAKNLLSIYIYLKKQLVQANMDKSTEVMKECAKLLGSLKEVWEEVSKEGAPKQSMATKTSGISIRG